MMSKLIVIMTIINTITFSYGAGAVKRTKVENPDLRPKLRPAEDPAEAQTGLESKNVMNSELKSTNMMWNDVQTNCHHEYYQYNNLSYDAGVFKECKVKIPDLRPADDPAEA